ncbi:MAB_1171c family putative transporter [Nocardia amamiensis]|uniref:MAB_1171c family putative transporter n=1 Tax=Nocardia amamiensis TaxID=404578 RepID=UPI0008363FAC|nr:MAB_1171c family putative transporter [Nocardia amamiensis]
MTSSAPAPVAWAILGFSVGVLVLRFIFFSIRADPSERLITYALAFGTLSGLLRERAVQDWLAQMNVFSVGFTRQLSTVVMVMLFAPLLLLVATWAEDWHRRAARTSRLVWVSAYSTAAAMLLLGSHARAIGQYIDRTEGWQTPLYFAGFSGWCAATGLLMLRPSIHELRAGHLRPEHRLTYVVIAIIGGWAFEEAISIFISSLCAATGYGSWFVGFRFRANENNFVYLLGGGATVAAAGVMVEVARRLRIDPASRAVRQLTPMWEELVRACPEIPRLTRDVTMTPRQRVHRMTVEIRDALLVLGRYAGPVPADVEGARGEAIQIVMAIQRKTAGEPPEGYRRLQASARGGDVVDEVPALRKVAAHWEDAHRHAQALQLDGEHAL